MRSRNPGLWAAVWSAFLTMLIALGIVFSPASLAQDEAPRLSGLYSVRIAPPDLPASQRDNSALIGFWTLALGDDGAFSLTRQDVGEVASGAFVAGGVNLEFTTWRGLVGCAIPAETGAPVTYAWRMHEGALVLTAIDDACAERLALLTTRPLGMLGLCPADMAAPSAGGATPSAGPATIGTPLPVAPGQGIAGQEGATDEAAIDAEIDRLLQRATGCWATGDIEGFMALHSRRLVGEIGGMGPASDFNRELRAFMATPLALTRIGEVTLADAAHAWAYVEIDLRGTATPQRVNFLLENGTWVIDSFFLFGPPMPTAPPGIMP